MAQNEHLNPDAIYAAMAWLREYAESPQGLQDLAKFLDEHEAENSAFQEIAERTEYRHGAHLMPPPLSISKDGIEEIYPGEPESVLLGLRIARNVIFGPAFYANEMLQNPDNPAVQALSRFIADRAN